MIDPNIKNPVSLSDSLFVWSTCVDGEYSEILKGFNKIFNLKQGVSMVRLLSDNCNIGISFGCKTADPDFIPKLLSESKLIGDFLQYVQTELSDIITEIERQPFSLHQKENSEWTAVEDGAFRLEQESREELLLLMGRVSEEDLWLRDVRLTQRQSQCAALYLRGLSGINIARLLGISHDAVKKHFELIKKKLSAQKKTDLIRKLSMLKDLGRLTCEYINLQETV